MQQNYVSKVDSTYLISSLDVEINFSLNNGILNQPTGRYTEMAEVTCLATDVTECDVVRFK